MYDSLAIGGRWWVGGGQKQNQLPCHLREDSVSSGWTPQWLASRHESRFSPYIQAYLQWCSEERRGWDGRRRAVAWREEWHGYGHGERHLRSNHTTCPAPVSVVVTQEAFSTLSTRRHVVRYLEKALTDAWLSDCVTMTSLMARTSQ